MAQVDLEKTDDRGGMGWLWALIAIILIALLAWWLWPDADIEELPVIETEVAEEMDPLDVPETVALLPLADILANPDAWIGRTVDGQVDVVEVPTDRGFWIEHEGIRMFALLIDQPAEVPLDINAGQTIRMMSATVRDASTDVNTLAGAPVDADTQRILDDQGVFLMVNESDIEMM